MTPVALSRTASFVTTVLLLAAGPGLAQQPPPRKTYLEAREHASTAPKIAFDWDSATVLNGIDGVPAAVDLAATPLVADGPFNHLYYASGTADFRALSFSPTTGAAYVEREDAVRSDDFDGNFTASAYVYHSSTTPQDGSWDAVMEAGGRFVVAVQSTTGKVRVSLFNNDPYVEDYDYHVETSAGAIRKDEWHRIRVAHWGSGDSNGATKIWVDERELVSQPFTPALQVDYFAEEWDAPFTISSAAPARSWHGKITGVWALNEPQAPSDADARVRAAFTMDASSVTVQNGQNVYNDMLAVAYPKAADRRVMFYSAAAALDAPVPDESNPMSWLTLGVFSLSPGDRPTMLNTSALRYLTAATYEAWILRSADSGGVEFVLSNGNFVMKVLANDRVLCQFSDAVDPAQKPGAVSSTPIALERWYHVACSFDGLTTRLWVDGVNETTTHVATGTPGYYASAAGNLLMGHATYSFAGRLAGIRVWDRARTPAGGCHSKCTFSTPPGEACYNTATQSVSSCGTQGLSTEQSCSALCTGSESCNTSCGDTGNQASTCGAEAYACTSLARGGVFDFGLIYSAVLAPNRPSNAPAVSFREDMSSGRISNLILTRYLAFPADTGGGEALAVPPTAARARFAAVCSDWEDAHGAANLSDSSMIVIVRDSGNAVVAAYYNNDSAAAGGNGRGSYVEHTPANPAWTHRYSVYVYSNRINTALCELRYTTDDSPVLSGAVGASQRHIGGTMVRVGPLPQSDYFQTQQPEGHSSLRDFDTRMALFRFAAAGHTGQLLSVPLAFDNDSHLTVTGAAHDDSGENYLLVGKASNTHFSPPRARETVIRADLVHGSQGAKTAGPTIFRTTSSGGPPYTNSALALTVPGRYVVAIDIMTTDPVGSILVQSNPIPVNDPNATSLARGRMNGPAINWTVEGAPAGQPLRRLAPVRQIPLGAFGSTNFHRFYQEIEVALAPNNPTFYVKPVFFNPTQDSEFGPINMSLQNGIIVGQSWFVQRNADAAQVRVATANMWYRSEPHDFEFRNAADLMAARGFPSTAGDFAFSDPGVRGPFQFNADIVHMTEMGGNGCEGTCFDAKLLDQRREFRDTAGANDSRRWTEIYGRDEDWPTLDGGGAVFVAESHWPNAGTCPLNVADNHDRCYTSGCGSANYMACWMDDDGYGIGDTAFIPAATKVRSLLRQPILVLGAHLTFGANGSDTAGGGLIGRSHQITSLADTVRALIAAQPAIARNGTNPAAERIIVAGDLNLNAHGWGEHYAALRQLRARFGYAVDVAMALDNSYGTHVGIAMHDIQGLGDGCRQTTSQWGSLPAPWPRFDRRLDCDGALRYPWWSRTTYCDGCSNAGSFRSVSGDRVDFFILVGRGWEMDDPVRGYRVMQEPNVPVNPFAPSSVPGSLTGLGVNMWGVEQNASGPNYKPRFDIGYGTGAGNAAIETDHRPIGATLRIWSGADAR